MKEDGYSRGENGVLQNKDTCRGAPLTGERYKKRCTGMNQVQQAIAELAGYALAAGLIEKEDVIYSVNCILKEMELDAWEGTEEDALSFAETLDAEKIADGSLLEGILDILRCRFPWADRRRQCGFPGSL